MNFLGRVKAVFNQDAFNRWVQEWLAGSDAPGANADIVVNESTALNYSVFFSCLRVLKTFASVPIKEYRKSKDGRDETNDTGWYDI